MKDWVFFDVDTQLDFVAPAGALYVPGAEHILSTVERLNRSAGSQGIPLISTMDAHAEDDSEFRTWPAHCVAGTLGQRKPQGTLLDGARIVPLAPGAPATARQMLLEKQALDCFTNPNLLPLLAALGARRAAVYGVVTEYCVEYAALGLLRAGLRVEIVTDAVRGLSERAAEASLDRIQERGGRLRSSAELLASLR